MTRRTRRSNKIVADTNVSSNVVQTAIQGSTDSNTALQGQVPENQRRRNKRTSLITQPDAAPPTKKARKQGENEQGHHPVSIVDLQRTSSFYPGRGDTGTTLPASTLPLPAPTPSLPENNVLSISNDEPEVESAEDWLEPLDGPDTEVAGTEPSSGLPESMQIEIPIWQDPVGQEGANDINVAPADPPLAPEVPEVFSWPADTDILFTPGSNKITLMNQRPMLRVVVQDAMDLVRASLLCTYAFPDPSVARATIREALVVAAAFYPGASVIHRRLIFDEEYKAAITPLLRARIPLFRSEVKERCAAIISGEFVSLTLEQIKSTVLNQLSRYNYTFPTAANGPHATSNIRLVMRSRPYRNNRIISVIRDLFFAGGSMSFASQFSDRFPVHQGLDGLVRREVPVSMVALVATALYAAIHEWRTGVHIMAGFTANAYFDVFTGHVNTFDHIKNERGNAFHTMMADIHTKAGTNVAGATAPIAELQLDELDG